MDTRFLTRTCCILLVLIALSVAGCRKPEPPPDTFEASYKFGEADRSISISGKSNVAAGEIAEYTLRINNDDEPWQTDCYVLLVDSDSVLQEVSHERLDMPTGAGIQKPLTVVFPEDYKGALGLTVTIQHRGGLIATISVGERHAIAEGWPDVSEYGTQ